ncbi:hypothetical protein [Lusitaniella coriacea]|uniref:hypothetical protein n=1 Tax=Lusitaniella coriacea TaxID=1983105 RepID=UPI003CEF1E88
MHYQRFFSISIFHEYYRNKICSDFSIEPTQLCWKLIRGHRLILKNTANGLLMLMPVDEAQNPRFPLEKNIIFTFLLKLKNPRFASITSLDSDYRTNLYTFSNQTLTEPGIATLSPAILQREKAEQNNAFGIVEIHNNASLEESEFQIKFSAKERCWKYYLIASTNGQSAPFSIQDRNSEIKFIQTEIETRDRVVEEIQHRFPNSQPYLFQSETPIPCQEAGRQNIQLLKQGQTKPWIPHLPNPPNQHGTQVINALEDV